MQHDPADPDRPGSDRDARAPGDAASGVPESPGAPQDPSAQPGSPEPRPQAATCPYCGEASTTLQSCSVCGGRFDPLSRQVSQNQMGPWSVRSHARPHHPGCSYATLKKLIERGRVVAETVIRGPSTHQFWMRADRVPGVAHLIGVCHACGADARADAYACGGCGAPFVIDQDRQHLGLMPTRLLPGEAPPRVVATAATPVPAASSGSGGVDRDSASAEPGRAAPIDPGALSAGAPAPAMSHGAVSSADRRARSLRRQNAALLTACAVLSAVLVLLIGAVAVGGGGILPTTARDDGRSGEGSGAPGSTVGAGQDDTDVSGTDPVLADSGLPVDAAVDRRATPPGPEDALASPSPGLGTAPEPTLVERLGLLLTRRGPGDLEEAAALIRATENDPELRAEVQALLAVLRQQRGLPALRRLP